MTIWGFTPASYNTLNRLGQGLGSAVGLRGMFQYESSKWDKLGKPTGMVFATKKPSMTVVKKKQPAKKAGNSKVATVATVRRMIRGSEEQKQITSSLETGFMSRGSFYSRNLTALIVQGSADGQRIGDFINLKSLQINGVAIAGSAAQFYVFRILVLYSGEEYNPATMTTGGLGYNEVMVPNAIADTGALATTNPKACTVLVDRMYEVNSLITDKIDAIPIQINVNLKGVKFPYQASGSVYGKAKNLYVVVASYTAVDGANTDRMVFTANATTRYSDS